MASCLFYFLSQILVYIVTIEFIYLLFPYIAEIIAGENNLTLGFDATTQEGVHVNSIHVTTTTKCVALAVVDELPGGTAEDYADQHHLKQKHPH